MDWETGIPEDRETKSGLGLGSLARAGDGGIASWSPAWEDSGKTRKAV